MTAMQELIEWIEEQREKHLIPTPYQIQVKAQDLLAKEREQIVEARLSVTGLNHASPTDDNSLEEAEQYYLYKYEQKISEVTGNYAIIKINNYETERSY